MVIVEDMLVYYSNTKATIGSCKKKCFWKATTTELNGGLVQLCVGGVASLSRLLNLTDGCGREPQESN